MINNKPKINHNFELYKISSSFNDEIPVCLPFVKWAGGKNQILRHLEKLFLIPKEFNRYFEPFVGGGALFFHLMSKKDIICNNGMIVADINTELITTYNVIRNNVEDLIIILRKHEEEYRKTQLEYYYKLRDKIEPLNDIERAARFIALNKTCYNGLYRVNKKGKFNVPIGKYKNPVICDANNLRNINILLKNSRVTIENQDYRQVLEQTKENDFIYLDPPYDPTSITSNFTSYTNTGFTNHDQTDLAYLFKKLDDKGCKVLLSNSDTAFIRELYDEYSNNFKEIRVNRLINSRATSRICHGELLIHNNHLKQS